MVNIIASIIQFIGVALCVISAIAVGPSLAMVLFLVAAVLALPSKKVKKFLKKKLKIKSGTAIFLSMLLFIVAILVIPNDATKAPDNQDTDISISEEETVTKKPNSLTDLIGNGGTGAKDFIDSVLGEDNDVTSESKEDSFLLSDIPEFKDKAFVYINDNEPNFKSSEITTKSFEKYSDLDSLGRCGVVYACLSEDTMPDKDEERGPISHVYPSGWKQAKYDSVDGKYLYNRCHLIGWQLSAENDNKKNLITGTRYFNTEGMLPFENMVADYIHETGNHVMYRVTPIYKGNELVARGVQIEAYSVEDKGDGISFNVYCYNNQPGVEINYATGESQLANSNNAKSVSSAAVISSLFIKYPRMETYQVAS